MRKALFLALALALIFAVGCAGIQQGESAVDCTEYTLLIKQMQRLAAGLPAAMATQKAELALGIEAVTVQAGVCALGKAPDAAVFAKWQDRTLELAKKLVALQQPATATPAPQSESPTATPPATSSGLKDDIDSATVNWVGDPAGVQNWEIKTDLAVSFRGNDVFLDQELTNMCPEIDGTVANSWMVAKPPAQGKDAGASNEWMRKGAKSRAKSSFSGGNIKVFNVFPDGWTPQNGQRVCFAVACISRGRLNGMDRWKLHDAHWRTPFRCLPWQ